MSNDALTTGPAARGSYTARLARVFGGFALGSVSVVLLAVGLYLWSAGARQQDLEAHYERQSARIARQVSLRLEHYRQLADSHFRESRERDLREHQETSASGGRSTTKLELAACNVAKAAGPIPAAVLSSDRSALLFPSATGNGTQCLRLQLQELFTGVGEERLTFDQERYFDEVALVDDSGTVIFTRSRSSRILLQRLIDKKADAEGAKLATLPLDGDEYHAFRQPVGALHWRVLVPQPGAASGQAQSSAQVSERRAASDATWVADVTAGPKFEVCGLVRQERLEADSRHVNPAYFLWAVFVLAVGLLALPLGKLWLIGPHARFRRINATSLLVSAALGAALGMVLVVGFLARVRMSLDLDTRLRSVGDQLAERMQTKIEESARMLERIASQTPDRGTCDACSGVIAHDLPNGDAPVRCPSSPAWDSLLRNGETPPLWNSVFWADDRGEQRLKYMQVPVAEFTPMVNVSERDYFKRALAKRLERVSGEDEPAASAVAEVVRSMTTGDIVLIVARPTPLKDAQGKDAGRPLGVLAIETRLPALQHQVLPLGFQTAVLDAEGKVMLHSDNDAHHGETLFDDLDDRKELRSVTLARLWAYLSFEYLGSRSRAFTRPLLGNWSVVVIADTGLVDNPTRYMILLSLGILAAIGVPAGLLFWLARRLMASVRAERASATGDAAWKLRPATRLFQPDAGDARRYFAEGSWTLAGGWLVIVGTLWTTPGVPVFAATGTGLLVASACLLVPRLRRYFGEASGAPESASLERPAVDRTAADRTPRQDGTERSKTSAPLAYPWWLLRVGYPLRCAGLTTALVTAPAAVIFASAYDELIEGVARADQDHLAREVRAHPECLGPGECSDLAVLGFAAPKQSGVPEQNAATLIPQLNLRALLQGMSFDEAWQHPLRLVLDQLPPLSAMSSASGRLYRACPESDAALGWGWHRTLDTLELKLAAGATHRSKLPLIFDVDRELLVPLLVLAVVVVVIGVLSYLAYLSLSRLLFLRLLRIDPARAQRRTFTPETLLEAWRERSVDEKRILAQLAIDGYVSPHPKNGPALQLLAKDGLLDPSTLTIELPQLAEIARANFAAKNLDECEEAGGANAWTLVRTPLTVGVSVLLLCLGFTQADLTMAGLTVPSALSIIPMLLRMLGVGSAAKP